MCVEHFAKEDRGVITKRKCTADADASRISCIVIRQQQAVATFCTFAYDLPSLNVFVAWVPPVSGITAAQAEDSRFQGFAWTWPWLGRFGAWLAHDFDSRQAVLGVI